MRCRDSRSAKSRERSLGW